MTRRTRLYEGKSKVLYEGPEAGTLVQHFKDDATAFNNKKSAVIEGRGVLNNRISEHLFTALERAGIATHFLRALNMREQLIRKADMIPIEVVMRNIAAGSLCERLGLKEGEALPRTIMEFYYKSDKLGDPMISDEHITAFNWATPQDMDEIMQMAARANDVLSGLFFGVGILLVDFKLEFGRLPDEDTDHRIIVADEISPDCCRLWDRETKKRMDKDLFRRGEGGIIEAYREVAQRLGLFVEPVGDGKKKPHLWEVKKGRK